MTASSAKSWPALSISDAHAQLTASGARFEMIDLVVQLEGLEKQLLSRRGDERWLREILDDDFVEIGASGTRYDKHQTLEVLKIAPPLSASIDEFEAREIAADCIMVNYRLIKTDTKAVSRRTSIWKKKDDRWQIVFHQGTPASG